MRNVPCFRILIEKHVVDASTQEVVGTAGAEPAQIFGPLRSCKAQRIFAVIVVRDNAAVGRGEAAKHRQDGCRDFLAVLEADMPETTKESALFPGMRSNEFAHLVDGADAVLIALVMRVPPCEEAVAAQENTIA